MKPDEDTKTGTEVETREYVKPEVRSEEVLERQVLGTPDTPELMC
jgi:hypothetical protein